MLKNQFNSKDYPNFLSKLKGFDVKYLLSSAAHYSDLVSGEADLVLECTRKLNLEIAAAYGLIKEAGGVVLASDGSSFHNKKYLKFGQDEYLPIIAASTEELGKNLIRKLNQPK